MSIPNGKVNTCGCYKFTVICNPVNENFIFTEEED